MAKESHRVTARLQNIDNHILESVLDAAFHDVEPDTFLEYAPPAGQTDGFVDALALNELRNYLFSDVPIDASWIHEIATKTSIPGSLLALHTAVSRYGVERIRYYHYKEIDDDARLISVDSAGHDNDVASQLKIGRIIKIQSSSPLAESDSFWCFELGVPILFELHDTALGQEPPLIAAKALPRINTRQDQCDNVLAGHKSNYWVDIPLIVAGQFVGKLSCDLSENSPLRFAVGSEALMAWALAQTAAPYLDFLYGRQFALPLAEITSALYGCHTFEEVVTYCVETLPPTWFECTHASFFELIEDSFRSTKLVLAKTSYVGSKELERVGHYDIEDDGLTPWVARTRQSLRLQDLSQGQAPDDLDRQLSVFRTYDRKLRWRNHIRDSDTHKSFLAVPILSGGKLLGVLRFTEKLAGNDSLPYFTERDQRLLEAIATDVIAPRLMALRQGELSQRFYFRRLQDANAISLRQDVSVHPADAFRDVLHSFFPESDGSRKLYLFNLLEDGGDTFRHHIVGGKLMRWTSHDEAYDIRGSLTGLSLRDPRGVIFLNDQERAREFGALRVICPQARCALACRISYLHKCFGVIVIKSDRYDLFPEVHGRLLEMLAAEAGLVFARHELDTLDDLHKVFESDEFAARIVDDEWLSDFVTAMRSGYSGRSGTSLTLPTPATDMREGVHDIVDAVAAKVNARLEVRCEVDRCAGRMHQPLVSAILGNLLLHHRGVRNERKVAGTIHARASEGWLTLEVELESSDRANTATREHFARDQCVRLRHVIERGYWSDDVYLTVSRNLAYWHQMNGIRRGRLGLRKPVRPERECFVLSVPVDAFEWQGACVSDYVL